MALPKHARQNVPAYQRVADDLRSELEKGSFAQEQALPTEAELAKSYGVSRQTVRRAFQELVAEGLVYRVAGRGTFPSNFLRHGHYLRSIGTIEDLQAFAGTQMELLRRIELISDEEMAGRLELSSTVVARLQLRRLYEGIPFGLTDIYLPPELGQRLAESETLADKRYGTIIGTLEGFLDSTIAGANQIITVGTTTSEAAPLIELEAGVPCLRAERTYFDSEGRPVEVAINHYNPDRYSYRLQLRRRAG